MSRLEFALVVLLLLLLPKPIDAATQSLYDSDVWMSQRTCAKECFWWGGNDWLAGKLSCERPAENACYCRDDLQPSAKSVVRSCISTQCGSGATVDIASATSMYAAYCADTSKSTHSEVSVVLTSAVSPTYTTAEPSTTAITNFGPELTTSDIEPVITVTVQVTGPGVTKVLVPDPTSGVGSEIRPRFRATKIKGIWHVLLVIIGVPTIIIIIS